MLLRIARAAAPLCAALALLRFPEEAAEAAREALSLCAQTVLPSLFPFFVLSSLLLSCGAGEALSSLLAPVMRPLFSLSGTGAAALALGLCGGYPVGARTCAELTARGALSREESERLLVICNNAGPGFILGVCGGAVFHSARAGAALYLIHAASAMLTGVVLLRRLPPVQRASRSRTKGAEVTLAAAFPAAVQGAVTSGLNVCAFVVFFTVLARLALRALPLRAAAFPCAMALGFLELTSGVTALPESPAGFLCCAAMLGWGGVSVHCQTMSVVAGSGLSLRRYVRGKAVQSALSVLLALPALPFLFPR